MADQAGRARGYAAVESIYHAYLTGLVLTVVTRRSVDDAARLMFAVFRRQHHERFLPGLEKLGLAHLPHAVASAQYHYLSNYLGGVGVEYMPESDRKAWVRYTMPRWLWDGTAICGIPSDVSRAILRGWHGHNGVSLGNPRLGFVCTKQSLDGQPGLEGYYYEYDRELSPDERLRFAPGEDGPDFDPTCAPRVEGVDWPLERLERVRRNYAMEYVRNALPALLEQFGPIDARYLGSVTGTLIGMQFYRPIATMLDISGDGPEDFARLMQRLADAQDDVLQWSRRGDGILLQQDTWRLMRGVAGLHPAAFDCWNALWEGMLAVHNRHLVLTVQQRMDLGDAANLWHVRRRGEPRAL